MALKTSPRLVASTSSLLSGLAGQPPITPSCRALFSPRAASARKQCTCWRRRYATVSSADSVIRDAKERAAVPWPSKANPTPYDIFVIEPSSPYNKARYYHLVKLYHPDRHHHHHATGGQSADGLSTAVRLDRYRLVVLANDILSNPEKRKAYDSYGAGWRPTHGDIRETYRQADRSWRHRPGNAAGNATWEDWERWYEQRDGKERQQPVFMSNTYFVALVLATIAVGSAMQASRAMESASHIMEQREAHEQALGAVVRRRERVATGMGRHDRIDQFVRDRDNLRYEFSPDKYDQKPRTK